MTAALWSNRWFNLIRRRLGFPYWSLSAWAKLKVKNAVNFIGAFETALTEAARRHHADGVVCGHIHHAAIRDIDGITYVNTGDFVESCTAVAEHDDGRLEILRWQMTAEEQRLAALAANERNAEPPRGRRRDANPDRDGRLEAASQWRRSLARIRGPRAARIRRRDRFSDAAGFRDDSVADLWRNQARAGDPPGRYRKRLEGAAIDHIHIATEGPVGFAARRYCLRAKRPFTTSYHTRFPEYIAARTRMPEASPMRCCAASTMPAPE